MKSFILQVFVFVRLECVVWQRKATGELKACLEYARKLSERIGEDLILFVCFMFLLTVERCFN